MMDPGSTHSLTRNSGTQRKCSSKSPSTRMKVKSSCRCRRPHRRSRMHAEFDTQLWNAEEVLLEIAVMVRPVMFSSRLDELGRSCFHRGWTSETSAITSARYSHTFPEGSPSANSGIQGEAAGKHPAVCPVAFKEKLLENFPLFVKQRRVNLRGEPLNNEGQRPSECQASARARKLTQGPGG